MKQKPRLLDLSGHFHSSGAPHGIFKESEGHMVIRTTTNKSRGTSAAQTLGIARPASYLIDDTKFRNMLVRGFVSFVLLLFSAQAWTQCEAPSDILNWDFPCGTGLLKGQSFQLSETGTIESITIPICTELDEFLEILHYNCQVQDCNSGSLIGVAMNPHVGSGTTPNCLFSNNGLSSYTPYTFEFEHLGLIGGETYVFNLATGVTTSDCNAGYELGEAFSNSAIPNQDVSFSIQICLNPPLCWVAWTKLHAIMMCRRLTAMGPVNFSIARVSVGEKPTTTRFAAVLRTSAWRAHVWGAWTSRLQFQSLCITKR